MIVLSERPRHNCLQSGVDDVYMLNIMTCVIWRFIIHIFIRIKERDQGVGESNLSSSDACLIALTVNLFLADVSSLADCCSEKAGAARQW